ncbi:hypothetical protein [Anaerolactibacter massiliensis]|uniref:hypothetical protein n=1 Tax=Anaerolactibacter massiliensis TaxID=2044573 RepID=UPI000CF99E03|nr:hypothetical protein [Anaerolactibacter massiliensis]
MDNANTKNKQFDAAAAKAWVDAKNQVQMDFMGTLAKINKVVEDPTGQENDSIMKALQAVADTETKAWNDLGKTFQTIGESLIKIINENINRAKNAKESVQQLGKDFHL